MHHLFVVRVSKRVYVIPAKLVLDLIGERESRHKAIVDEPLLDSQSSWE